ncbi:hypothetical protein BgiBS90_004272, partial [Biomphalaria glabrata]
MCVTLRGCLMSTQCSQCVGHCHVVLCPLSAVNVWDIARLSYVHSVQSMCGTLR